MKIAGRNLVTNHKSVLHSSGTLMLKETHMDQDPHATNMTTKTSVPLEAIPQLSLLLTRTMNKLSSAITLNNGALTMKEI